MVPIWVVVLAGFGGAGAALWISQVAYVRYRQHEEARMRRDLAIRDLEKAVTTLDKAINSLVELLKERLGLKSS